MQPVSFGARANARARRDVGGSRPPTNMKLTNALLLLPLLAFSACGKEPKERPNIVLITLDTTRADHLGCYGYERPTSPVLDALARESVVYDNAYAVSSWTMPTHASLFTGKFPSAHGAKYDPNGVLKLTQGIKDNPAWDQYRANPIADDEVTLAAVLAEEGYATGGVVAGPWLKKPFRLNRGFQFYDDENVNSLRGRDAEDLTKVAKGFIDRSAGRPFFLFLNYYDAHGPFDPRWDHIREFKDLGPEFQSGIKKLQDGKPETLTLEEHRTCFTAFYDSEIAYADAYLGELFAHLRAKGLWENTWIIVTADHGELMGDPLLGQAGLWGHGNSLSQAEIHIPMVVKYPSRDGSPGRRGRDDTPVQQVDVMPTILAETGIELPEHFEKRMQGNPFDRQQRPIFAEVYPLPMMSEHGRDWRHRGSWKVLLHQGRKYVQGSEGRNYLVDVGADPDETKDLLVPGGDEDRRLSSSIRKLLESFPEPGGIGNVEDLPDDVLKGLEGLGYIGGDG